MRLILLGAPGAGKGTQASIISKRFNIPHISTGDIFRKHIKEATDLGRKAKKYIDKGLLVPDDVTIDIVKDRIKQPDCSKGFILDGFPRTIPQAQQLDSVLEDMKVSLDYVINIYVPDQEIVKRLSGRRVCTNCGINYHIVHKPTKVDKKCDNCGSEIVQREDDQEETVIKRLKTYHEQTEPLVGYYKNNGKLVTINGRDKIEETSKDVMKVLGVN